jgi:hypothetical protein
MAGGAPSFPGSRYARRGYGGDRLMKNGVIRVVNPYGAEP